MKKDVNRRLTRTDLDVLSLFHLSVKLTFKPIFTQALVLILCIGHTVTSVQTRPAVTWAVVQTLVDRPALCEAVGQIHLLVVDGDLTQTEQASVCQWWRNDSPSSLYEDLTSPIHPPNMLLTLAGLGRISILGTPPKNMDV